MNSNLTSIYIYIYIYIYTQSDLIPSWRSLANLSLSGVSSSQRVAECCLVAMLIHEAFCLFHTGVLRGAGASGRRRGFPVNAMQTSDGDSIRQVFVT